MKKVYLFCSNGMSTSMLASKMQGVADSHNLPIKIAAFPYPQMGDILKNDCPDCILLGPQIKFMYEEIVAQYSSLNVPIALIDQGDYGMMNGEKVLKTAIKLIKSNK